MNTSHTYSGEKKRSEWIKKKLAELPTGIRILDAGAGEQPYKSFCSHLQYVSQDFAAYHPHAVKEGLQMPQWNYGNLDIISDITAIPVEDESFDAILCTEVFEHIPYPIEALKEFSRILKKGGTLILTAPFCSLTHFAPFHFYSGFNRYFYETVLPQTHFTIVEMEVNGNYFEYLRQEIGRTPYMVERYLQRKPHFIDTLLLKFTCKILNRYASLPNQSSDLLNFGFHILAKKQP